MKIKRNEFLIFIIILVALTGIILNRNLGDLDELWNYNFARNVYDGKIPYKDFNMLQMPLLPLMASIFLKIIANELLTMRILAIILCSFLLFLVYKILKILDIKEKNNILSIMFIGYLFKEYFCIDYNFGILLNLLIIIYIELKYLKNNSLIKSDYKLDFIVGLLSGLCITYKQTTGIIIALVCIGYKVMLCENKENFKEYAKILCIRIIGLIIPIRFNGYVYYKHGSIK